MIIFIIHMGKISKNNIQFIYILYLYILLHYIVRDTIDARTRRIIIIYHIYYYYYFLVFRRRRHCRRLYEG